MSYTIIFIASDSPNHTCIIKTKKRVYTPATGAEARRAANSGLAVGHLYVLSDEQILEGDYVAEHSSLDGSYEITKVKYKGDYTGDAEKIVCTTDPKLDILQIPDEFVREYCVRKGGGKLLINISKGFTSAGHMDSGSPPVEILSIRFAKEVFTRSEVEQNIVNCVRMVATRLGYTPTSDKTKEFTEEARQWIKEWL